MIGALKALFEPRAGSAPMDPRHQRRLAAAALLIETARADFQQDAIEEETLTATLREGLGLTAEEVAELVSLADREVDAATSLYQFTRQVNDHFTPSEKYALIVDMWKVAHADGEIDRYEEHLIRRVAELVYVPHEDYIRAKLETAGR